MKTLAQKIDEIHIAVTTLEERVPQGLRERVARLEDAAHAPPCRSLRAWGRFAAGVGVAVAAWLATEILRMTKGA